MFWLLGRELGKMTFKCSLKYSKHLWSLKSSLLFIWFGFFITMNILILGLTKNHSQFNKLFTKHETGWAKTLTILFQNIIAYLIQQPKRSNTFFLYIIFFSVLCLLIFICVTCFFISSFAPFQPARWQI